MKWGGLPPREEKGIQIEKNVNLRFQYF
jgi:hypothetical protein